MLLCSRSKPEDERERLVDRLQLVGVEPSCRPAQSLRIDRGRLVGEDTGLTACKRDRSADFRPPYTAVMASVDSLEGTTLSEVERRTLSRFLGLLEERLGHDLVDVWLYGSRARGEPRREESDVDVMVVTRRGDEDWDLVNRALWQAAQDEGASSFWFSFQLFDPEWLEGRRRIKSFYIQEVDRDKVDLRAVR